MLDWDRRHLTMRTHTALHILCGVIWAEYGVAVTGGNMDPGKGRLDFPLPSMSAELGSQVEAPDQRGDRRRPRDPGRRSSAARSPTRTHALIRTRPT